MNKAVKVGIFSIVALAIAVYFVLRIQHIRLGQITGIRYTAMFENAEGLQSRSWVMFKGVRVGRVGEIRLEGDQVAVPVTMQQKVPLRVGTSAQIINVGLLGDKQLELVQGPPGAPLLANGARIPGKASASMEKLMTIANQVGEDVQSITGTLRGTISGDGGVSTVTSLVANLDALTAELRQTLATNQEGMAGSLQGVKEAAASISELTRQLSAIADKEGAAIDRTAQNASETAESLKRTARIIEELAKKLAGTGATGPQTMLEPGLGVGGSALASADPMAVADSTDPADGGTAAGGMDDDGGMPEGGIPDGGTAQASDGGTEGGGLLVETLNSVKHAADNVTAITNGVQQLKVGVNLRFDYLTAPETAKGYFGLWLKPNPETLLLLQAVTVPMQLFATERVNVPEEERVSTDVLTWTLLLGRRWDHFRVRGGLIESRVGLGGDTMWWHDRLWLSADVWDVSRTNLRPHARLEASVFPWDGLYLVGGWDDLLNARTDSLFVGAGFLFGK